MPIIADDDKIREFRKAGQIDRKTARELTKSEKPKPKEPDKSDLLIKELKSIAETSGESVKLTRQVFGVLIQVIESLRDRPIVVNVPESGTKDWMEIKAIKYNNEWTIRRVK